MFIVGVSVPTYTEKELEELNRKADEKISYKGKEHNEYEASQYQRKIETSMRASKRSLIAYKESGLTEDFKNESIRLNQMRREYKDFSSASGLRPKPERSQVLGFGRSISQQATNISKK